MSDDFKLPGSSFQEVSKIIQGYATLGKASSLGDVSKATGGMDPTTISRNSGFLVGIGILEPGKNKAPTSTGISLGNALMHEQLDEVKRLFCQIVDDNEFLKGIVSAIRIRKGMDDNALRSHIAYSAGAKKGNTTTAGAGTIIEILQLSGWIAADDGRYVVAMTTTSQSISGQETTPPESVSIQAKHHVGAVKSSGLAVSSREIGGLRNTNGGVTININIEVSCNASDLDTLGHKLRQIIEDLGKQGDESIAEGEADAEIAAE